MFISENQCDGRSHDSPHRFKRWDNKVEGIFDVREPLAEAGVDGGEEGGIAAGGDLGELPEVIDTLGNNIDIGVGQFGWLDLEERGHNGLEGEPLYENMVRNLLGGVGQNSRRLFDEERCGVCNVEPLGRTWLDEGHGTPNEGLVNGAVVGDERIGEVECMLETCVRERPHSKEVGRRDTLWIQKTHDVGKRRKVDFAYTQGEIDGPGKGGEKGGAKQRECSLGGHDL